MNDQREKVEKVLALFDDEDIPYIHSNKLDSKVKQEVLNKPKVKIRGGYVDRQRK